MIGTIASIWGLCLGVGTGIDLVILRRNHKVKIYTRIGTILDKIRQTHIFDLSILIATTIIKYFRPLIIKQGDCLLEESDASFCLLRWKVSWSSLVITSLVSIILSSMAFIVGFYVDHPGTSLLDSFYFVHRPSLFFYSAIANLPFDILTVAFTLHILTLIIHKQRRLVVLLILLDLVIAGVLALAFSCIGSWFFASMLGFQHSGFLVNIERTIIGGLWFFFPDNSLSQPGYTLRFLHASTTFLPTVIFLSVLMVAILSKPFLKASRNLLYYLLSAAHEYDQEPDRLPVATMIGSVIAVVLTLTVLIDATLFP